MRLYYYDNEDDYNSKLASGDYYSDQYFTKNVQQTIKETDKSDTTINLVKVKEKYQHYVESMK